MGWLKKRQRPTLKISIFFFLNLIRLCYVCLYYLVTFNDFMLLYIIPTGNGATFTVEQLQIFLKTLKNRIVNKWSTDIAVNSILKLVSQIHLVWLSKISNYNIVRSNENGKLISAIFKTTFVRRYLFTILIACINYMFNNLVN